MNGSALARLIENGGVTLYPLLLCSTVSVAVMIERAWTIARATRARARVHDLVVSAAAQGNLSEALIVLTSAMNTTVGCCVITTWPAPGLIVAVSVLISAVVEAMVAVATPLEFVVDPGWVSVLPVPVDAI